MLAVLLAALPLHADKRKDTRTRVLIETTAGNITLALYDETPVHRDNFIKLVKEGFYDGLLFHRTIEGFMIQSGDPDSRNAPKGKQLGEGGPGYTLPAEILYPQFYHKRGALAAAREGDDVNPERRSSGSQFYIVWGKTQTASQMAAENALMLENTDGLLEIPDDVCDTYEIDGGTPHLDGLFTVFGEVVEGLKTVRQIQRAKTDVYDRPVEDIKIIKATVIPPKTE